MEIMFNTRLIVCFVFAVMLGFVMVPHSYAYTPYSENDQFVRQWLVDIGAISAITWAPDGQTLAAVSLTGALQIWNASDGQIINTIDGQDAVLSRLYWNPDRNFLIATADNTNIYVWDIRTNEQICIISVSDSRTLIPIAADWSPNGTLLAARKADGTIDLWRIESNFECNLSKSIPVSSQGHNYNYIIEFSPSGRELLGNSNPNTLGVWDVQTGELRTEIPCPLPTDEYSICRIFGADWSLDGHYILGYGYDAVAGFSRVWNVETSESRDLISLCTTAAFNWMPNQNAIYGWCYDGQIQVIRVWDFDNLNMIASTRITNEENELITATSAISPDGERLAIAYQLDQNNETFIQIWNMHPEV
jgi:WD40 repeat protein